MIDHPNYLQAAPSPSQIATIETAETLAVINQKLEQDRLERIEAEKIALELSAKNNKIATLALVLTALTLIATVVFGVLQVLHL